MLRDLWNSQDILYSKAVVNLKLCWLVIRDGRIKGLAKYGGSALSDKRVFSDSKVLYSRRIVTITEHVLQVYYKVTEVSSVYENLKIIG